MIVPQYWAEARLRQIVRGKAVTIRRFGWSDDSPEAAQAHAEGRAKEAMERAEAGEGGGPKADRCRSGREPVSRASPGPKERTSQGRSVTGWNDS